MTSCLAWSAERSCTIEWSSCFSMLSRMPDFWISEYKESEYDSYKFIGADKKPLIIEGHKYSILYKLNSGASDPGALKIMRNYQDALKKIGGKSEIKAESDKALEQIAILLKNNESLKLNIVGHTDNVGTIDANMKLSQERAVAVVSCLITKYGIRVHV